MISNVQDTMDMLSEYEEGSISEMGLMELRDNLLDIIGELNAKEITEGFRYETHTIHVAPDTALPEVGKPFRAGSALSGQQYELNVKEISKVYLNDKNMLFVEVLANKTKVKNEAG